MLLIILKFSKHLDVIWVCICICTTQVLVHAEYPEAFRTASTSEMSLESGAVYNQTVILDRIVNKQESHINKLSEYPWYFNSAAACHISPLVPLQKVSDIKRTRLYFLPTQGRHTSPLGASQCVLYDSKYMLLTSPDSQQQGIRLSAGEKRGWEGHCRAPVCQRGLRILMPFTAEPSAGYYTW